MQTGAYAAERSVKGSRATAASVRLPCPKSLPDSADAQLRVSLRVLDAESSGEMANNGQSPDQNRPVLFFLILNCGKLVGAINLLLYRQFSEDRGISSAPTVAVWRLPRNHRSFFEVEASRDG